MAFRYCYSLAVLLLLPSLAMGQTCTEQDLKKQPSEPYTDKENLATASCPAPARIELPLPAVSVCRGGKCPSDGYGTGTCSLPALVPVACYSGPAFNNYYPVWPPNYCANLCPGLVPCCVWDTTLGGHTCKCFSRGCPVLIKRNPYDSPL